MFHNFIIYEAETQQTRDRLNPRNDKKTDDNEYNLYSRTSYVYVLSKRRPKLSTTDLSLLLKILVGFISFLFSREHIKI